MMRERFKSFERAVLFEIRDYLESCWNEQDGSDSIDAKGSEVSGSDLQDSMIPFSQIEQETGY